MDPILYLPLFSAIINGLVGIYVFYLNPKKITNRVFAVLVLFFAIFCIGEFITRVSGTKELALIGGRIGYSVFILVSCLAVHFSLVFPRKFPKEKNIFLTSKYLLILLYIVAIILVIIFNILISIQDVKISAWGFRVVLRDSTVFIIYWLSFCTFYAAVNLIHTYFKKNISINEKKQIEFVTVGFLLIVVFGLGTNLVPPLIGFSIFPMTTFSLLVFSVVVTYSMIKYRLMKLTIAETADAIVDTMSDLLIVIDKNEKIVNVNKSTLKRLGYHKEELMNFSLKQIIKLSEREEGDSEKVFESKVWNRLITERKLENIDGEFVNNAGKTLPMSVSASAMYNSNRNLEGIVLVARDLTEIKKSIKEKEVLLKEVHHRVKNNLQFISSLLDLQSEQIKNKHVKEMFRESQNRIKLMASLHEELYQSKNLAKINFGEYIQSLITNLFHSYEINPDIIALKINTHDIFMDVELTLPCSLIINELVSNSLKHAFPSGEKGEIIIDFRLEDNTYTLAVSDTGVGFPKNVDFQNTKTLGLQLVNMFIQRLKGNIKLDRIGGTKFIITFEGSV